MWHVSCPCGSVARVEPGRERQWVLCCLKCGGGMDLIDRLADRYNASRSEVLDGPNGPLPWERVRPRRSGPAAPMPSPGELLRARRELWSNRAALDWLRDERGLSDEIIRGARLGYGQPDPRRPSGLILPVPAGRPVTYRIRYWPEVWVPPGVRTERAPKPVKIATPRGHTHRLYPGPVSTSGGPVVLAEAELDALCARAHGVEALAVPGCQAPRELLTTLARKVGAGGEVAVCFDVGADDAASRAVGILRSAGARAWAVDLGLGLRHDEDLTDWFMTYGRTRGDLLRLIEEARS